MTWDTAGMVDRFQMYLGRGNGGTMQADELWTTARVYTWLADAQESVFADIAPRAAHVFVGAPTQLVTADGGITYTYPGSAYPFGHVEVYAQESGGRTLLASNYGTIGGDFLFEGSLIRTPGNRPRQYVSGPWARYTTFPARIAANQEPTLQPLPARELILFKALENAAEVSNGAMDPAPWQAKYDAAVKRWLTVWQTQYQSAGNAAYVAPGGPWWLGLDSMNGVS